MALTKSRLTLWQLMVALAVLAVCLALFRANIAFGTIAVCVSSMTIARTARAMRAYRISGKKVSAWTWLHAGLGSLVVSALIIGSADLTFVFVSAAAPPLWKERVISCPGPIPELDENGVLLGILSGLAVGYFMRRRLWNGRWNSDDSPNDGDAADPPAAGR